MFKMNTGSAKAPPAPVVKSSMLQAVQLATLTALNKDILKYETCSLATLCHSIRFEKISQ